MYNAGKKEEAPPFNPNEWEQYLVTEEGEKCQCPYCKQVLEGGEIGSHFYCPKCQRYIWKKKYGS